MKRSNGDKFGQDYIVLYMWGEYFIDIVAHKVGKNANIGHFGYVINIRLLIVDSNLG